MFDIDLISHQFIRCNVYKFATENELYPLDITEFTSGSEGADHEEMQGTRRTKRRAGDDGNVMQMFKKIATQLNAIGHVVSNSVSKDTFKESEEKIEHLTRRVQDLEKQNAHKDLQLIHCQQKETEQVKALNDSHETIAQLQKDMIFLADKLDTIDELEEKIQQLTKQAKKTEAYEQAIGELGNILNSKRTLT